jgi:hypothetical protein
MWGYGKALAPHAADDPFSHPSNRMNLPLKRPAIIEKRREERSCWIFLAFPLGWRL